jgi:hypothetical protein
MSKRPKLSYANVMSTLCFFLLLGGGAYAAGHLGKNTVGTKQLKKNAVTTKKIKKNAVTGAKVKANSLTGKDVKLSKLGTVPSAENAATAGTANIANSLAPSEGWHEVGAPGEPPFQNEWHDPAPAAVMPGTVAFFKDHEGVVHLKGTAFPGTSEIVFQLPPGYRPASGRSVRVAAGCKGGPCTAGSLALSIIISGPNTFPGYDGAVVVDNTVEDISFDGVTFRAES